MNFDIRAKNRTYDNLKSNDNNDAVYWWLAVNGPSCATSAIPLPIDLTVHPVPEQLVGFMSRDEQIKAKELLLTAPMTEVEHFMTQILPPKINRGEVIYIRPTNPEPPSHGPTMWSIGKSETQVDEKTAHVLEGTFRCKAFPR